MNKIFDIPEYNPFYEYAKENYSLKSTRDKIFLEYVEAAVKRFKKNFKNFKNIKILFTADNDCLGRYLGGSASSYPIILLCRKEMIDCAKETGECLELIVHTTVYHELGHAMCELDRDCDGILEYEDEEEVVEEFACDFYFYEGFKGIFQNFKI